MFGITGMSTYFGVAEVGDVVQAGETLVVSSAAVAVGSIAGQIAKIRGARVIGIAGGAREVHMDPDRRGARRDHRSPF